MKHNQLYIYGVWISLIVISLLLIACSQSIQTPSLIAKAHKALDTNPSEATRLLDSIDPTTLSDEAILHHYHLLRAGIEMKMTKSLKSDTLLRKAKAFFYLHKSEYPDLYADATHLLSCAYNLNGNYYQGVTVALEDLEISNRGDNLFRKAEAQSNIGDIYNDAREYGKARLHHLIASSMFDQLKDYRQRDIFRIAAASENIPKGDFRKAVQSLDSLSYIYQTSDSVLICKYKAAYLTPYYNLKEYVKLKHILVALSRNPQYYKFSLKDSAYLIWVYLAEKDPENALNELNKVRTPFPHCEQDIHYLGALKGYYDIYGTPEQRYETFAKLESLNDSDYHSLKLYDSHPPELVYLHEQINASKDGISSLKKTNILITFGSILVLVLLMSFMIYSRSRHQKQLLAINEQINTTSHNSRIIIEKNLNLSEQVKFLTHEVDTLLSATRSAGSIAILNSMCRQIFDIDDATMRNRMIAEFVKTELDRANHPAFLKNRSCLN